MADSYNKKEREKKKRKRRQEKLERKQQRKLEESKNAEFMYVGADGNLTSTPPDPADREKIELETIEVSIPKKEKSDRSTFARDGVVKFFNVEKGYGFILDPSTNESFFVHVDNLSEPIKDGDKVTFEVGKGPKGPIAIKVSAQQPTEDKTDDA